MQTLIGRTVSEALAICDAGYGDVRMLDEPPGKLKAIALTCREGGQPKRLVLELEYGPELFSADRSWPEPLVRAQRIVNVRPSTDAPY
jgi:hypothetical protein